MLLKSIARFEITSSPLVGTRSDRSPAAIERAALPIRARRVRISERTRTPTPARSNRASRAGAHENGGTIPSQLALQFIQGDVEEQHAVVPLARFVAAVALRAVFDRLYRTKDPAAVCFQEYPALPFQGVLLMANQTRRRILG